MAEWSRMFRLLARASPVDAIRAELASAHLAGRGLEIGALHQPLKVSRRARVQYVDRFPAAKLREHYPELAKLPLIEPDLIDDGQQLRTVPSESQDFVVANHFIEHCENPIGAVRTFLKGSAARRDDLPGNSG